MIIITTVMTMEAKKMMVLLLKAPTGPHNAVEDEATSASRPTCPRVRHQIPSGESQQKKIRMRTS